MSGDDFGPDHWPHDQPAADDHGDDGSTGSAAHEHFSSGHEPEPDPTEYDRADDPSAVAEGDRGSEVDPQFDDPEGTEATGAPFDPVDLDHFAADADLGPAEETSTPPGPGDHWAAALGTGAADPAGTQPGSFDHLDLSPEDRAGDDARAVEPEWLTDELAGARASWVDPSLAEASGAAESSSLLRSSGPEAVAGLWARLAPGTPMPPDVTDALDTLAAGAGTATSLGQVIDAARRLLDG